MADQSDHPYQHDLEFDKALAFGILMQHGRGVPAKSPGYIMEKLKGLDQCRKRYEVASFLDVFGQHIFYGYRDTWFKEDHGHQWPYDDGGASEEGGLHKPSNEDSLTEDNLLIAEVSLRSDAEDPSSVSTTLVGEKQEAPPTLRFIKCGEHPPYQDCYLQDDGTHLQRNSCICGSFAKEECPLDLHRRQAVRGFTGESGLYA